MNIVLTEAKKIDQAFEQIARSASRMGPVTIGSSSTRGSDVSLDEPATSSRVENIRSQHRHFYERILVDANDDEQVGPLTSKGGGSVSSATSTRRIVDQLADQIADRIVSDLVKSGRK